MQPQRPLASPEGRSKPGYPLADYAEFEKIHKNIAKHLPTVFSFSYASKGLSSYKMRYFAKLKFAPCVPRGQLKSSIMVRAERVCAHNGARTPSTLHMELLRISVCTQWTSFRFGRLNRFRKIRRIKNCEIQLYHTAAWESRTPATATTGSVT